VLQMGFLFSAVFWGVVLVIIGLSVILKAVFNIDIPVFRVVSALIIIYVGVRLLLGPSIFRSKATAIFSDVETKVDSLASEYNIIFGKGDFDISGADLGGKPRTVKINTIFGQGIIRLGSNLPVRIDAEAVFGEALMPDQKSAVFGKTKFESSGMDETKPFLTIKAKTVFGSTIFKTDN